MYNCHVSQIYEWLPYTHGALAEVPTDEKERLEWYRTPRAPCDKPLPLEVLLINKSKNHNEYYEALPTN